MASEMKDEAIYTAAFVVLIVCCIIAIIGNWRRK